MTNQELSIPGIAPPAPAGLAEPERQYHDDVRSLELPDLPPGTKAMGAPDLARAEAGGACQSITVSAIQALIDRISAAAKEADANVAANGPGTGGGADDTAVVCAQNVRKAEERLTGLLNHLHEVKMFGPSGDLVNPVGGYAVYNRAREAILALHYARHFGAVSAAWNSKRDPSGAMNCIAMVTSILDDLEALSAQATRCYLSLWYRDM